MLRIPRREVQRRTEMPVVAPRLPVTVAPAPQPGAPSDQFQPAPLTPITINPSDLAPITGVSRPEAGRDAQVRSALVAELDRQANAPVTAPRGASRRLVAAIEASRREFKNEVEAAKADPSGAALIRLAANQFQRGLGAAGVSSTLGRLFPGALSNEVSTRIATISPKEIAREGFAATLDRVLQDIRAASDRLDPAVSRNEPPSVFEQIARGG